MKFLLWIVVIWLAVQWYLHAKKQKVAAARARQGSTPALPEQMVSCAHCGLHVPASEAVAGTDTKQHFCSDEHRRLHRA